MLFACLSVTSMNVSAQTLSAGVSYSLAIREDGTVVAWGFNDDGQCNVPSGLNVSTDLGSSQIQIPRQRTNESPPILKVETTTIGLEGSSVLGALSITLSSLT